LLGGLVVESVLFRHELAYVLGQMGDVDGTGDALAALLVDENEHEIVRHEAAEGLAALGKPSYLPVLERFVDSTSAPLRETCQIAVESLKRKIAKHGDSHVYDSAFKSEDPMKGDVRMDLKDVPQLRSTLLDQHAPLPQRYEALFTLRNLSALVGVDVNETQAVADAEAAIIESLDTDRTSALFRHEVAFVLGQMLSRKALPVLTRTLNNKTEHGMSRHEAALALGSVIAAAHETGNPISDSEIDVAWNALKQFTNDDEPIVAETCVVALSNIEAAANPLKQKC